MIKLITPYFVHPYKRRNEELLKCLYKNAENPLIDEIILLTETPFPTQGKIKSINIGARPTFANALYNVPITANDIIIVANSDISFEGLENLKYIDWRGTVLALSRTESNGNIEVGQDSQDAWIFKGRLSPMFCNFFFGQPGCDNRIASEFKKLRFNIFNPAHTIKAIHHHGTDIRTYTRKNVVPEPYHFVPVCSWHQVPKIKLKKILHIGIEKFVIDSAIGRELEKMCDYHFISWMDYCTNYQFTSYQHRIKFEDECTKWAEWADEVLLHVQTANIISPELAAKMSGKALLKNEIPDDIASYDKEKLQNWLRYNAGTSDVAYFNAFKGFIGLELQQVPEEYSQLLDWFREQRIDKYLELGLGRGGSFVLNMIFNRATYCVGVDSCTYWGDSQYKSISDVLDKYDREPFLFNKKIFLHKIDTDTYFEKTDDKDFDCIFIDADHSFEGVRKDTLNSLKLLKQGGYLIFHDIHSAQCEGVVKVWNYMKKYGVFKEFIHGDNCGIGVIKVTSPEEVTIPEKKKKYALVIVESRKGKGLKETIENHRKYLPLGWDVKVYCSKLNIKEAGEYGEISEPFIGGIQAYNELMTSANFWKRLRGYDRVLISQTDSRMLRKGIKEFLKYDMAGAPHTFSEHTCNGGFSLRNPYVMQSICENYKWDVTQGNEDVWFCNIMKKEDIGWLAPITVNKKFSCEAIFKMGTIGVHAIARYHSQHKVDKLMNQYEKR